MECEECPDYIPCMQYEINNPALKCPTVGKCGVCMEPWGECTCVFTSIVSDCECCGGLPDIFGKCLAGCDDD